jgi:hypothetical protein
MDPQKKLRELLLDYKLGQMKQKHRDRFDERIFQDPEFSAALEDAEFDLLDDYRAGRLSAALRKRVERAFSPSELKGPPLSPVQTSQKTVPAPRRPGMLLPTFALACSALIVAGIFFVSHRGVRRSLAGNAQEAVPPPKQAVRSTSAQSQAGVASLLLTSEIVRDGSALQLPLPAAIQTVRIQWVVPAGTTGSRFVLSIVAVPNILCATIESTGISTLDNQPVAQFLVPADLLRKSGDRYLLAIRSTRELAPTIRQYALTIVGR